MEVVSIDKKTFDAMLSRFEIFAARMEMLCRLNRDMCISEWLDKGNAEMISRMNTDWETFTSRVMKNTDGTILNPIQLSNVQGSNPKIIGEKLNEIKKDAYTNAEYFKIGKLYDFDLLVRTEGSNKDGLDLRTNRFFIEGEGNIKYTFNNGYIANDPKLASLYFLNALEKIPKLIENNHTDTEKISKDLPVLREVVNGAWRNENELKELKSELAALDRKIQLSLKPIEGGGT